MSIRSPSLSRIPRIPRPAALLALLVLPLAACSTAGTGTGAGTPAARAPDAVPSEVRAAVEDFIRAWESEDVEGVMRLFAPDAVAFDPVPPGRFDGPAIRTEWVAPSFDYLDDIRITSSDVEVEARGSVAWLTGAYVFRASSPDGAVEDAGNLSMVWVRQPDASYRIAVFHASPPVD